MYNTKDFFKDFRLWYESAKESKRWSEYSYREGRLRGMNEMAYYMGLISFNTWEALETLLQKLTNATIEKQDVRAVVRAPPDIKERKIYMKHVKVFATDFDNYVVLEDGDEWIIFRIFDDESIENEYVIASNPEAIEAYIQFLKLHEIRETW